MRLAIFTGLTVLLVCCGKTKEVVPPGILPEDSMVKVLAEVHLLEAAMYVAVPSNVHPMGIPGIKDPNGLVKDPKGQIKDPNGPPFVYDPLATMDSLGYYNIFSTFHITRQRYDTSMKWYCTHPDVLNALYDKVETELTMREMKEAR